jgi:hypothetical protein
MWSYGAGFCRTRQARLIREFTENGKSPPCPDGSRFRVDERSFEQNQNFERSQQYSIKEKWIGAVITFITQG